jgi:hypothetical protein
MHHHSGRPSALRHRAQIDDSRRSGAQQLEPADKLLLGLVEDLAFGSALRGEGAERREQLNRATERAIRKLGKQLLATGRFPHISALFDGLSDKQSAALVTSTTEDERFELGLTAILDRFDPAAAARPPTRKR